MNIDKLILKEQKKRKKTNTFSMDLLLEMVEEILEVDFKTRERKQLLLEASGQTMTFEMIPEINISELGWARGKTPEGAGYPIGSGARQQLEQYLKHIEGNNFPEKLASLQAFYTEDAATLPELSKLGIVSGDESNGQQVQKILGYLVFYKTLTTIVTNFNASSAGFSFEAFLGVLLGGSQIKATGADTIADMKDENGQYISLKLYTKGGVEVGGSFHDLVGDLVDHPMHYIVGMKKFSGEGIDANGQITFWGFTFTRDNVMTILAPTKDSSREALRLPLDEDNNLIDINTASPGSPKITAEDYDEALKNKIAGKDFWEQVGVDVSDIERKKLGGDDAQGRFLFSITNPDLMNLSADKPSVILSGIAAQVRKVLGLPDYRRYTKDEPQTEEEKVIADRVDKIKYAIKAVAVDLDAIAKAARTDRTSAIKDLEFADVDRSFEYYKRLEGQPELQNKALRNTKGFLKNIHFSMSEGAVKKVHDIAPDAIPKTQKDGKPFIGALDVGSENVQNMLNLCKDLINQSVFDIFKDVKELTTKVNQFFSSGMMDTDAASEADVAAKSIESETKTGLMGGGKKGDGKHTDAQLWDKQSAGGDTAQPGASLGEQKENKKDEVVID